jgi:hypothetical protein
VFSIGIAVPSRAHELVALAPQTASVKTKIAREI